MPGNNIKIGGQEYPKVAVYGGLGVVAIAAIFYYRNKKQQSDAAVASVAQAGTNAIDPATGYPYGSAEDAAALSSQDAYQSPSYASGIGAGGGSATYTGQSAFGSGFTSNAQWAQYVEQYEINTMGADAATVGNTIGKYITGQPLTSDAMLSIVQSAIAIGGYPPVAGPNGNPPGYVTAPTPTTVPPSTTGGGYHVPGSISNLQVSVKGTTATFTWNPTTGTPTGYSYVLSEMNHVVVKKDVLPGSASSVSIPGLHRGWTYNFGIQALPGGEGNNIHVDIP